jgi:hypothetical protein
LRFEAFFTHEEVIEYQLRFALARLLRAEWSAARDDLKSLTQSERSSRLGRFVQGCVSAADGKVELALNSFQAIVFPPKLQNSSSILSRIAKPSGPNKSTSEESRFTFLETKIGDEKEGKKPSTAFLDRSSLTEVMTEKDGRTPTRIPVVGVVERRDEKSAVNHKNN